MEHSEERKYNSAKKHKQHKKDKKDKKHKEHKRDKDKRLRHRHATHDASTALPATAAEPQPAPPATMPPSAAAAAAAAALPPATTAAPPDPAAPAATGVAQMSPLETQEYVKRVLFREGLPAPDLDPVQLFEEFTDRYAPLMTGAAAASDDNDDDDDDDDDVDVDDVDDVDVDYTGGDSSDYDSDGGDSATAAAVDDAEVGGAGGGVMGYDAVDDNADSHSIGHESSAELGIDFGPARAKEEEIWVLKLPPGVELPSLAGRVLHLPCDPPEARHLRPPKDLLSGRYDLLAYVKAAVKPTPIGHMELDTDQATACGIHEYRELHQEGEYVAANLRCAAPVGEGLQQKLRALRVARVVAVSDDVFSLDRRALAAVLAEGGPHGGWGQEDGWDGGMPPRRRRKRVAGWDVVGQRPPKRPACEVEGAEDEAGYDDPFAADVSSSESDEEFDELVFLPDREVPILKEDQERQQQLEEQQKAEGYGPEQVQVELLQQLHAEQEDPVDWDARQYQEGWDLLKQHQQQQNMPGPFTQPDPAHDQQEVDLYQFMLSLPVRADVLEQQQEYSKATLCEQHQEEEAAPDQHRVAVLEQEAAVYEKEERQQQDNHDTVSPSSQQQQQHEYDDDDVQGDRDFLPPSTAGNSSSGDDDGSDDYNMAKGGDDGDDSDTEGSAGDDGDDISTSGADESQQYELLPPPRPIPSLLDDLQQYEQILMSVSEGDYGMFIRLRNCLIKLTLSYPDLCAQVDMEAMSDDAVATLCEVLEEVKQYQDAEEGIAAADVGELEGLEGQTDEDEDHQVEQTARLLLPSDGPSPRPHFKQVDQGYAPYQVDDEGREYIVIPPPSPDWNITDSHLANRVVQDGAGRLHKFVSTHELRSKGFEWDTDPEDERREGLIISLPDGRSMHIPGGLHFDFDS